MFGSRARQLRIDRKTVRKHIAAGLTAPSYKARPPLERAIASFEPYLRERLTAYPTLTGRRLWREIKERGYAGGYTAVTDLLRELRPPRAKGFEEAPITKSSDRHPARLGNFTSALLGKSKSAFTQR
jgi:transposase